MGLDELIAELAKLDKAAVVGALHSKAAAIWQEIFNKGHAAATAKLEADKTALETRATTAETELKTVREQLAEADKKQPDVAKIKADYQQEIADLKEKHKATAAELKGQVVTEKKSTTVAQLKAKLADKLDADYADVQVSKQDGRIRVTANGIEIMQEGKEIPYAPASGQTAIDLLAEEIVKAAPAKFVKATTDRGTGTTNGQGGGLAAGGLAALRTTLQTQRKEEAARANPKTGAERLGMKAPA